MREEGNFGQEFVSDKGEKRRLLPQMCPVCAHIILCVCACAYACVGKEVGGGYYGYMIVQ